MQSQIIGGVSKSLSEQVTPEQGSEWVHILGRGQRAEGVPWPRGRERVPSRGSSSRA